MTGKYIFKGMILVNALLILGAPAAWASPPPQEAETFHLGSVKVHGQKKIVQALEAIKLALKQPFSSDPRLKDVVVCRITTDIGTHVGQILTCATNGTFAKRQELTQLAYLLSQGIPAGGGMAAQVSILNEFLPNMPQQMLRMRVNGPGLQKVLAMLPYPAPVATTTVAPDARTHN